MKKGKKWLLCATAAMLLALSLTACSGGYSEKTKYDFEQYAEDNSTSYAVTEPEAPMPMPQEAPAEYDYAESAESADYADYAEGGKGGLTSTTSTVASGAVPKEAKLIKTVNLSGETRDFDAALAGITADVTSIGGYTESTSVSGKKPEQWSDSGRNAYITARIPAEKLDAFLNGTRGRIDIINEDSSVEDVGSHYYDLEARKATYEIQLQRLESILTDAAELADVLALETEIARVRYEIESIDTSLRSYDGRVSYSTVNISFYELTGLERPQATELSFGERIGNAISEGFRNAGDFFKNAVIWLAGAIPVLIVLVVLAVIIIIVIVRYRRKNRARVKAAQDGAVLSENTDETIDVKASENDEENKTEE